MSIDTREWQTGSGEQHLRKLQQEYEGLFSRTVVPSLDDHPWISQHDVLRSRLLQILHDAEYRYWSSGLIYEIPSSRLSEKEWPVLQCLWDFRRVSERMIYPEGRDHGRVIFFASLSRYSFISCSAVPNTPESKLDFGGGIVRHTHLSLSDKTRE